MVEDYIADIKYTINEATMGSIHGIKMTHERVLNICPTIRMSSNTIIQPTETIYGTGVVSAMGNESVYWYRNASNNQAIARNISYCFYFSGTGPSLSATNVVEVPYINIRASQINVRANNSYMPLANFNYVDADNTIFKMRFRLYQVDKRIFSDYAINNNLVYMYENNTFPTGIY